MPFIQLGIYIASLCAGHGHILLKVILIQQSLLLLYNASSLCTFCSTEGHALLAVIFFTTKHTYIVGTLRAVDMRTLPCFVAFRATEKAVTSVHCCAFLKFSFFLGFIADVDLSG